MVDLTFSSSLYFCFIWFLQITLVQFQSITNNKYNICVVRHYAGFFSCFCCPLALVPLSKTLPLSKTYKYNHLLILASELWKLIEYIWSKKEFIFYIIIKSHMIDRMFWDKVC